jgi:stringent starvation protein B
MALQAQKIDVFRALLQVGSVFVHFEPARGGSIIPERLLKQTQVVLQFGLDMAIPIPDLKYDGNGIFGTLTFKGIPFTCFVPWHCIFALVGDDGKGLTWDIPKGLLEELSTKETGKVKSLSDHKSKTISHHNSASLPQKTTSKRPIPSYLRLVK